MKKFLLFIFLLPLMVLAQQTADLVKITDMYKMKQMSAISLSPDGKHAAFVLNSIEPEGNNKWEYKYTNQLYLVAADGSSSPRALTYKESASQPVWSPDGKKIAFVHYPDKAEELAKTGKYDLIFYGHDHKPWEKLVGQTKMLNPGTLAGMFSKPTFAIYDTATDKAQLILLEKI